MALNSCLIAKLKSRADGFLLDLVGLSLPGFSCDGRRDVSGILRDAKQQTGFGIVKPR